MYPTTLVCHQADSELTIGAGDRQPRLSGEKNSIHNAVETERTKRTDLGAGDRNRSRVEHDSIENDYSRRIDAGAATDGAGARSQEHHH